MPANPGRATPSTAEAPKNPPASKPEPKREPKPTGRASLAEDSEIVRMAYYSDPGKGKTTDMAHMAKLGKVIYIDAENRLKASPLKRMGVPIENIEPIKDVSYQRLDELSFEIKERLDNGEPIVGLAWDSATETSRLFTQALVDRSVAKAAQAGKHKDPWSTELADWGDMTEQMRRLLRRFRDLPIHLAVSCLANRSQDEEGAVTVEPALSPAVYRDFMGYMDLVLHCRMELVGDVEEYSAQCKPVGRFVAKDSFGVMPRVLITPTFDRVLAYVRGELTAAKDPIQQEAKARRLALAEKADS